MASVYVKVAEGGRVRMPDRDSRPVPPEGVFVELNAHYQRLILAGDLIVCDPPSDEAAKPKDLSPPQAVQDKPDPAPVKSTAAEKGRHR